MFEGENSLGIKAQLVIEKSVLALVEVSPLLILPLIWVGSICIICAIRFRIKSSDAKFEFSEVLFFGFIGSSAAYINELTQGSFLQNLVPSFVLAITFVFQLAGLSFSHKPLSTSQVFLSASGTAICFVFASRYLSLMI